MTVDLQTIIDALEKEGITAAHFGQVQLFVNEPKAQHPLIHLEIKGIDVDERGISVLLLEWLPS